MQSEEKMDLRTCGRTFPSRGILESGARQPLGDRIALNVDLAEPAEQGNAGISCRDCLKTRQSQTRPTRLWDPLFHDFHRAKYYLRLPEPPESRPVQASTEEAEKDLASAMCPNKRLSQQVVFGSSLDLQNQVFGSNSSRLREAFEVLDRDGDGIIAAADLEGFLQKIAASKLISKNDVRRMLALVEGDVDYHQFLRLLKVDPTASADDEANSIPLTHEGNEALQTMFGMLDKNGDGVICSEDLKSVMNSIGSSSRRLSEGDIHAMLQAVGAGDHEKKVTYNDFVRFISYSKRPMRAHRNGLVLRRTTKVQ
ncbi:hypothetical protein R1sor_017922 [Riccia sorocarpa]|uniref:EF-hand domain-containing protein n=1 Tax=Riccia sorocarpa TaxID=122646 RepID=A0ABD3I874_9MARC